MSSRDKSKGKSISRDYVAHVLNHSKTKSSFSFEKSNRFQVPTSYSPNKFYDLPSGQKNISCSMGKSQRAKF